MAYVGTISCNRYIELILIWTELGESSRKMLNLNKGTQYILVPQMWYNLMFIMLKMSMEHKMVICCHNDHYVFIIIVLSFHPSFFKKRHKHNNIKFKHPSYRCIQKTRIYATLPIILTTSIFSFKILNGESNGKL